MADQRLDALLDRGLSLPREDRAAFLAGVCGEDTVLHARLERLLALAERDGGFLERSPLTAETSPHRDADDAGRSLGAYRLLRRLGAGGMGEVWLAERRDGAFEQRVAIKRVHAGAASLAERFRRERQILARLVHPNIAHLIDGGVADDGRPWLAMEYVEGEPLAAWCDRHALSLEARVRLLLPVCDAVQFAHRNLIVHRDIKPANLWVTREGVPKLLDFGIARLLDDDEGGHTLTLAMTPAYASPEQRSGGVVTTASDVYQLGLVLYELLSGVGGQQAARRNAGGTGSALPRMLAAYAELVKTDPQATVRIARDRRLPPERLRAVLGGDLGRIVARATAADPGERYVSAQALADDLGRWLGRLPVRAHRGSVGYRLGKFVGRNRYAVAVAGALALALAGTVAWSLHDARTRLAEVTAERTRAQGSLDFLASLFAAAGPSGQHGPDATARDVLISGIERLRQDERLDASARADLLIIIGESLNALSLVNEAKMAFDLAAGQQALYPAAFAERARLRMRAAINAQDRGELDAAERAADALLADIESEGLRDRTTLNVHALRANLLLLRNRQDAAHAALQPARRLLDEAVAGIDDADRADILMLDGFILTDLGRFAEATAALEEALARYRGVDPDHPTVGKTLTALALVHQDLGEFAQAKMRYLEGIAQMERVLGADSRDLAIGRNNFAGLLLRMGETEAAAEQLREVLRIRERLGIVDPRGEAIARNLLGQALLEAGRDAEARAELALALTQAQRADDEAMAARARFALAALDCRAHPATGLPVLQAQLPDLEQASGRWRALARFYYAGCLESAGERSLAHAEYAALADGFNRADHINVEIASGLERTRER